MAIMSIPHRILGCVLPAIGMLLLTGCATHEDPIGAVAPLAARLPEQLGGFQRVDKTQVATLPPSLGVRYRHQQTQTTVAVFLRQGLDAPWPDGAESPEIQTEIIASTLALVALLGNVPVAHVPDYALTPAGESAPALRCTTVLVPLEQQVVRRETVCAAGLNGTLVKVHVSGLHPRDRSDQAFQFFSSTALQALFALRADGPVVAPRAASGPVFRL
jgi:hypothetical protein